VALAATADAGRKRRRKRASFIFATLLDDDMIAPELPATSAALWPSSAGLIEAFICKK
jgi:hypothetical protein